jgi:hypothetical protein
MKKILLLAFVGFLGASSCTSKVNPSEFDFERKYRVRPCRSFISIVDDDPKVVVDMFIDSLKGVILFRPSIDIMASPINSINDFTYLTRTKKGLEDFIVNKFLVDKWVVSNVDLGPFGEDNLSMGDSTMLAFFKSKIEGQSKIVYSNWKVANNLILDGNDGYNLFLRLEGSIGASKLSTDKNKLYLFLIDNNERRVVYSDMVTFECDLRNFDAINRVLDYTFLKLLEVRFAIN